MSDSSRRSPTTPGRDACAGGATPAPASSRPFTIEDVRLANPLTARLRDSVSQWLRAGADELAKALAAGPDAGELAEQQMDLAEWTRVLEEEIAGHRRLADQITSDEVAFTVAARIRNLINQVADHNLRAATAALHAALTAALPRRLASYHAEVQRKIDEAGYFVQVVAGQDEPLPLPDLAYTRGLGQNASHPELVMVGIPTHVAQFVFAELTRQILAGERTLQAGEEITGVLADDIKLRVGPCPAHLLSLLHQDPERPAGALQLFVPDAAGRFPGDPGVDPHYEELQTYPDHPA